MQLPKYTAYHTRSIIVVYLKMAFNRRRFWKFIYDNDDGSFYPLAEVVGPDYNESYNEELNQMINHLGSRIGNYYLDLRSSTGEYIEGHDIEIGTNGKTLKDLDIKVRITPDGRWYYLRAYLAQDFIDSQNDLSQSVIETNESVRKTNKFIRWTFVAVAIGVFVQLLALYYAYKTNPPVQIKKQVSTGERSTGVIVGNKSKPFFVATHLQRNCKIGGSIFLLKMD
jgi:hypothetical protein